MFIYEQTLHKKCTEKSFAIEIQLRLQNNNTKYYELFYAIERVFYNCRGKTYTLELNSKTDVNDFELEVRIKC